jgi:hypothetical protein
MIGVGGRFITVDVSLELAEVVAALGPHATQKSVEVGSWLRADVPT